MGLGLHLRKKLEDEEQGMDGGDSLSQDQYQKAIDTAMRLTVSAPPEYRDAEDHLISNSSSPEALLASSNFETNEGSAFPEACSRSDIATFERYDSDG